MLMAPLKIPSLPNQVCLLLLLVLVILLLSGMGNDPDTNEG